MSNRNEIPWFETAKRLIGVKEIPGSRSSSTIMNWARVVGTKIMGIAYAGDHVPWCGLAVAYCMKVNGIGCPSIAVRASQWGKWGVPLREGAVGAVLVFTRNGGGHVGFYVSEDANYYHVLGGNQSDAVNVMKIAKSRCTGIRWPAGKPLPTGGPVVTAFRGPTSTNEA